MSANSVRILIVAVGSHGDVVPFIRLGAALRLRGHDARLYSNAAFEPLAAQAQLPFVATSKAEDMQLRLHNQGITDPREGMRLVARAIIDGTPASCAIVAPDIEPGNTLLVGSSFAFSARLLAEGQGLPFAAVQLAPSMFRSEYRASRISAMGHMERWPRWFKRGMLRVIDRRFLDPLFCVPLNDIRTRMGLPPVQRVLHNWIHHGAVTLGLFPEWFASRQPDWPAGLRLTGFPLCDGQQQRVLPLELEDFLSVGPPPVVFTAGTANTTSQAFYAAAAEACRLSGRRGILVAQRRDQLPDALPEGVMHAAYAPFGALFPRAAAAVHHGGIGTLSHALAAGVPQLIQPMAFDQFDNASHACRLGVARELPVRAWRAPRVVQALDALTGDAPVREACARMKSMVAREDGIAAACDALLGAMPPP